MLFEKFKQGINLGGFLSQYEIVADLSSEETKKKHFETFIQEQDIQKIAQWGFDHVRIPMDGYLFFDRKKQGLKEEPLAYLDRCLGWCETHHLNAVLDLHNFWGHEFGKMQEPTSLMTDDSIRADYCRYWECLAEHFSGYHKVELLFELFNEIADATDYRWNQLYKETVKRIRAVDETRWILVGSNDVNSVGYLKCLDLLDDPYVFYNFHYYEPNAFTHQQAHFSEEFCTFKHPLSYPGDMRKYQQFLSEHPKYRMEHSMLTPDKTCNDYELMKTLMKHAEKFVTYSGRELYCGEFGVIDSASEDEAVKWLHDFVQLCNELHIGHAMWNYKCLDFELVDETGAVVRPKVLEEMKRLNGRA